MTRKVSAMCMAVVAIWAFRTGAVKPPSSAELATGGTALFKAKFGALGTSSSLLTVALLVPSLVKKLVSFAVAIGIVWIVLQVIAQS